MKKVAIIGVGITPLKQDIWIKRILNSPMTRLSSLWKTRIKMESDGKKPNG